MSGYTKLWSSILESTIWNEDHPTVRVWITMLAMKDQDGFVAASVPGLAVRARVTTEECRAALVKLLSPDEDSRTKDFEGRRISEADGGWVVLNHEKYRSKEAEEERKEYRKNWMRKRREQARTPVNSGEHMLTAVNSGERIQKQKQSAEEEAESEASGSSPSPASVPTKPVVRKKPKSSPRVRSEPPSGSGLVTTGDQEAPKEKPVHVKAIDWFGERFLAQRGVKYEPTALDFTKTAQMLLARKDGSTKTTPTEWARRAEIMLGDEYEGTFKRASPKLLADNWNEFAVAVRRMDKHQQRQMELQAAIERGDI